MDVGRGRYVTFFFVFQAGYDRERSQPAQVKMGAAFFSVPGHPYLQAVPVGAYRIVIVLLGQLEAVAPGGSAVVIDAFDHGLARAEGA